MPININDVIQQSQLPYSGWFWVYTFAGFFFVFLAFILLRSESDPLLVVGLVATIAAIVCVAVPRVHHYVSERQTITSTITEQVRDRYNLDIGPDVAENLRTGRNLPSRVTDGQQVFTLDVLEDGNLVVVDSAGVLVQPSS